MFTPPFHARSDDRGAVLIYVALALVGLMAMATFVVDYGIFWVARGQSQNVADAAAHAGVLARTFDNATEANAAQAGRDIAGLNGVWDNAPPAVTDVSFVACPDPGTGGLCARADVYRNGDHGNPLPTVFGRLLSITSQDVHASAIAEARPGNVARCLKPWAVPDLWTENTNPGTFDKYEPAGPPGVLLPNPDTYTPPSLGNPGTGYQPSLHLGTQLTLHVGNCRTTATCLQAREGNIVPLNLQGPCLAPFPYLNAITGCTLQCVGGQPVTVALGNPLLFRADAGGLLPGQTQTGVNTLIGLDPGAYFDPGTRKVKGSCADPSAYSCAQPGLPESPRIVALAAYDVDLFETNRLGPVPPVHSVKITVTNFLGVFLDHIDGSGDVVAYLVTKSGDWVSGSGGVSSGSAFTNRVFIVR